jgi:hypothetical protein
MVLFLLRVTSRDTSTDVVVRGGVAALLAVCAGDTPATQAPAARVLQILAAFPDLLPAFHDEGALLLLQLVSLAPRHASSGIQRRVMGGCSFL